MLDYIFRLFANAPSPSQDPPFGTLLLFLQSVTFEAFKSSLRTHFFQKYNIFTNQVTFLLTTHLYLLHLYPCTLFIFATMSSVY